MKMRVICISTNGKHKSSFYENHYLCLILLIKKYEQLSCWVPSYSLFFSFLKSSFRWILKCYRVGQWKPSLWWLVRSPILVWMETNLIGRGWVREGALPYQGDCINEGILLEGSVKRHLVCSCQAGKLFLARTVPIKHLLK